MRFALFFKRFALLTTIIVLIISLEYRDVIRRFIFGVHSDAGLAEFYALPVFTCAGLMWMASAIDFVMIFVSLELVTISFYILVAYMRRNTGSLEAGVKYLVLGALSTGFFVYGVTWVFGVTGTTNLAQAAAAMRALPNAEAPLLFGFLLLLVGIGFKVAAVPFQFWVPDVYQGAPTPVTAFLSVGSKAAGFIVLIRVVETFIAVPVLREKVLAVLSVVAGATLIYGNLAAMPQNNLKRLLAYSSIAHAGYLLIAVASLGGREFRRGHRLLPRGLPADDAALLPHPGGGGERLRRRRHRAFQRARETLPRPGLCAAGRDAFLCGHPAHRGLFREVLRLRRRAGAGALRAGLHRHRDRGRGLLLLPESGARDVLAGAGGRGAGHRGGAADALHHYRPSRR